MGEARVTLQDGTVRKAACIGGMLTVRAGVVRLVATTFEWAEDIDKARADASKQKAESILKQTNVDPHELDLAQARLKRALVRSHVANNM